jgi:hypothetical protein
VAKTFFGFVLLLCFLRCKCMIIFSEIITFVYSYNFTCQCQKKSKNWNIKSEEKKIYTLNKILPYGSLPYTKKTWVVFLQLLMISIPLLQAGKILCVIITVCTSQSLVLLRITATYLWRKIIGKKMTQENLLQWMCSSKIDGLCTNNIIIILFIRCW